MANAMTSYSRVPYRVSSGYLHPGALMTHRCHTRRRAVAIFRCACNHDVLMSGSGRWLSTPSTAIHASHSVKWWAGTACRYCNKRLHRVWEARGLSCTEQHVHAFLDRHCCKDKVENGSQGKDRALAGAENDMRQGSRLRLRHCPVAASRFAWHAQQKGLPHKKTGAAHDCDWTLFERLDRRRPDQCAPPAHARWEELSSRCVRISSWPAHLRPQSADRHQQLLGTFQQHGILHVLTVHLWRSR